MKVLLVDDDDIIRAVLAALFDDRGDDVISASSGEIALDMLDTERPDLIMLDMSMPGMTGFEFLEKLRGNAATKSIPVIALSAHEKPESRDAAYAAGCNRYVTKPVERTRVMQAVEEVMG